MTPQPSVPTTHLKSFGDLQWILCLFIDQAWSTQGHSFNSYESLQDQSFKEVSFSMEEQLAVPNFIVFSKVVNNGYSHSQEETEAQEDKITCL